MVAHTVDGQVADNVDGSEKLLVNVRVLRRHLGCMPTACCRRLHGGEDEAGSETRSCLSHGRKQVDDSCSTRTTTRASHHRHKTNSVGDSSETFNSA